MFSRLPSAHRCLKRAGVGKGAGGRLGVGENFFCQLSRSPFPIPRSPIELGTDPTIVNKIKGLRGFWGRQACFLSQFSGRRLTLFYGIMYVLSGIELRGDGGTNGSLESRGLKTDLVLLRTDRKA